MEAAYEGIHKELKEELLIIISNTVVYPWTVMVHSGNASFTN
jgi:hypothetical protein